jgi:hypothetical protein
MAGPVEIKLLLRVFRVMDAARSHSIDSGETLAPRAINRQVALMNSARAAGSIDTFELTSLLWGGSVAHQQLVT